MRPWNNAQRRELQVRGRQGVPLTMVVTVYRNTVWMSVEPLPDSDVAILESPQADNLAGTLTWAAAEARRYSRS